jgi:hypothetical protein
MTEFRYFYYLQTRFSHVLLLWESFKHLEWLNDRSNYLKRICYVNFNYDNLQNIPHISHIWLTHRDEGSLPEGPDWAPIGQGCQIFLYLINQNGGKYPKL